MENLESGTLFKSTVSSNIKFSSTFSHFATILMEQIITQLTYCKVLKSVLEEKARTCKWCNKSCTQECITLMCTHWEVE